MNRLPFGSGVVLAYRMDHVELFGSISTSVEQDCLCSSSYIFVSLVRSMNSECELTVVLQEAMLISLVHLNCVGKEELTW